MVGIDEILYFCYYSFWTFGLSFSSKGLYITKGTFVGTSTRAEDCSDVYIVIDVDQGSVWNGKCCIFFFGRMWGFDDFSLSPKNEIRNGL
jgi:hypothetical protein